MTIEPLGSRLLIKILAPEEKTKSGILIPSTAQEKPQQGEVIALGSDVSDDLPSVKVGDTVLFAKYTGTEIKIDGENHLLLESGDVLALVKQ